MGESVVPHDDENLVQIEGDENEEDEDEEENQCYHSDPDEESDCMGSGFDEGPDCNGSNTNRCSFTNRHIPIG